MKRLTVWSTAAVSLALCLGLAGCGGSDDETLVAGPPELVADPCPVLALPAGASAPTSATGAYLCAAGVGVTNLEASVTFYKALGMKEKARLKRAGRDEVVMVSADARGSQLVLYTQTDGTTPNYQQNPGKIVFYVKDATAFSAALTAAGGTLSSPPVPYQGRMVGFGRDLDKNLVEIASDATVTHSYISAFGVGVADLEAAKTFYVDTLDMKVLVKLSVTKPNGMGGTTPWYDEYILQSTAGKGSAVVLMQYTDGVPKNYANNPVKLVYRVDDPAAYVQRIAASGKTVVRQAVPSSEPALGGAVSAAAKDADGTLIEIFKSPQVEACAPLAAPVPASGAAAPVSASGAYLCSAGLGVSNLEASATFYKTAFGMTERSRITRVGRNEIVLDSADKRGSQLVLFTYTDGSSRNYKQTPGKVVFYVKDTAVTVAAVNALGGQASVPVAYQGRQVSFGQDPDGTLVEITSEPTAVVAYLSAYGIGVSNLEAAKDFYVNTLDMKVLVRLSVTKAPNVPWYDEYILTSKAGRGSAIVLMTYTDGSAKNYTNNPIKLGMRANQPGAYARSIYDIGKPVLSNPRAAPEAVLGDALVGYATDADGSLLEILSSPN